VRPIPSAVVDSINSCILRIDTLCHEGLASQKVMRFSHLTFRKQNMPQTAQNKDQFGLHGQALRVKDGTMSTLQGSLHSPIKDKCVQ
jgi:hypothetical protein